VEIGDFIIEVARALQRYGMYPEGHPSRLTTADEILQGLTGIIGAGGDMTIQVSQDRLLIGDLETDEKNSSAVNIARRLHQHQLHIITFTSGVTREELDALLGIISVQVGKSMGEPFGASPPEILGQWPHIKLQRTPYDSLRLADGTEDFEDDSSGFGAGGQGRTGWRTGGRGPGGSGAASALQLEIAELLENLDVQAQQKLLELFRTLLNADGVDGSHDQAVLKLVELTRKGSSKQAATMLGVLSKIGKKLGASDPDGPTITPGSILNELIKQLSGEAPAIEPDAEDDGPVEKPEWIGEIEAERVLQMSVELREMNPATRNRLAEVTAAGEIEVLNALIRGVPEGNPVTSGIVEWIGKPKNLQRLLNSETLDLATLDLLLPLIGADAIGPMLDLLVRSERVEARGEIIERLVPYGGEDLGPLVMERMDDPRWEVRSALLTILSRISPLPDDFAASNWYLDDDRRVRLQAMRYGLIRGEDRGKLLLTALRDPDEEIARFGLDETKKQCPPETATRIIATALNGRETSGVRLTCIRAMAGLEDPGVLDALLSLTWQRRVFITYVLLPKSPEMLESLSVIASRFVKDSKTRGVLKAARKSKDPQIRAVAGGKKASS